MSFQDAFVLMNGLILLWCALFVAWVVLGVTLFAPALIRRALVRLTDPMPAERISHQGRPFLDRFHVGVKFGRQWYIHHMYDNDPDGLHSHPWKRGRSLILLGRYIEQTFFWRRTVRFFNTVNGEKFHRILIPWGGECWTLFWHDARCKEWVFRRVTAQGVRYDVVSDFFFGRPFSDWHLYALKGRELRRRDEVEAQLGVA